MTKSAAIQQEFKAIQTSLEVLEPLDATQRQFALAMILSRLGIAGAEQASVVTGRNLGGTPASAGLAAPVGSAAQKGIAVKEFVKQKAPTTDLERFVCLGYYLTHMMDTPLFTTRDVTKLNAEAHGVDFSNAAATANNAVKQSRFLSRGGGGKRRITTLGESVVEALPDRAKVKEIVGAAPRRGRKGGKRRQTKSTK